MSDDIQVTSGGAVAVDTESLDHAARGLDAVADRLDDLARRASDVARVLESASDVSGGAGVHRALRAAADLGDATGRARITAGSLREAARTYEIVELSNERDLASAAGDRERMQAAESQLSLARKADPGAAQRADDLMRRWRLGEALDTQAALRDPLLLVDPIAAMLVAALAPFAIRAQGGGLVARGALPAGPAPAVELTALPVGTRDRVVAPSSSASLLSRVPGYDATARDPQGDARVRVERYELPDGSQEFAVYIAGTSAPDFLADGDDEAWDGRSNWQLYHGQASASYEAVLGALDESGARPGDAIDLVGFSQGGMIASWVAQSDVYDVKTLVTAGSPVLSDVQDGVVTVVYEHTDDLVAALPGSAPVDGPGTVVVERTVDEAVGYQDLLMPAHRLEPYIRTAELFDASGDPRTALLHPVLSRLASATAVTATEYGVTRVR